MAFRVSISTMIQADSFLLELLALVTCMNPPSILVY